MSMDDVFDRARVLEQELENFNARLRASFEEVTQAHDDIGLLWDDSMRREYDKTWTPLAESMEDYVHRVGPQYVSLLIERLRSLRLYLYGHEG